MCCNQIKSIILPNMASIKQFLNWAYEHSNNRHPKYGTLAHSLYISITGIIMFIAASLLSESWIIKCDDCKAIRTWAPGFGYFLIIYVTFMIASRYHENGSHAIYEVLWACNLCIIIAAIGLITHKVQLVRACLLLVSLDQLLW